MMLLDDPPDLLKNPKWLVWLFPFGWWIGYQRQIENERRLVEQAIERGPVPETVWEVYDYDPGVRRGIEEIVLDHAYPPGSTFHPLDPFELMAVIRYGDFNEVAILRDIETQFCVVISNDLVQQWLNHKTPFIEIIHWVEENRHLTRRPV